MEKKANIDEKYFIIKIPLWKEKPKDVEARKVGRGDKSVELEAKKKLFTKILCVCMECTMWH